MIDIEKKHLQIIQEILAQASVDFFAFGSRTKHTNRKFSDLDLCYKAPLDRKILVKIKTELEESNLPFSVDIVDYNQCDNSFKQLIDKDLTPINKF
jgi:predicted nucleotidyltransferase